MNQKGNASITTQYYNKIASTYEDTLKETEYKVASWIRKHIQKFESPQTTILDTGCGNGVLLDWLRQQNITPAKIVGIDLSSQMLSVALQKGYTLTLEKDLNFGLGELDESYDIVTALGYLEFLEETQIIIKNIFKATKVGGYAFLTFEKKQDQSITPHPFQTFGTVYRRSYTEEEVKLIIETAGFTLLSLESFFAYRPPSLGTDIYYWAAVLTKY
jgi:2-polyprenyl-3-methyl-5-hydroxy-6-metoxy-1,4-benzoquinol methylase